MMKLTTAALLVATAFASDCETFKDTDSCTAGVDMDGTGCEWCSSAAVPGACHNATMAGHLPSSVFKCAGAEEAEVEVESSDYYMVLALQKCDGSDTWSLHGLWPEWGQNCGSEKFDESQISSIESDMEKYWLSCPEYSSSNLEFWDHEWSKHGTCTTDSQSTYFSNGLAARSKFLSHCTSGTSCEICVSSSSKSAGSLTYYGEKCP